MGPGTRFVTLLSSVRAMNLVLGLIERDLKLETESKGGKRARGFFTEYFVEIRDPAVMPRPDEW